jgi:hypothetical protein
MNVSFNYESLLGKTLTDAENLLLTDNKMTKKVLKNFTYLSLLSEGVSLVFQDGIMNSIYFYNEGMQGFKKYKGNIPYINLEMKNKQIVEFLGDTNNKGGGGLNPIWLVYNKLGLEINFVGKNWTDIENPISFICLFPNDLSLKKICSTCTKTVENEESILRCEKRDCNVVSYCSSTCKKAHIEFHNKHCKN